MSSRPTAGDKADTPTLVELETQVQRQLAESASDPAFWTSADIRAAINEGYEELSDYSEWHERSTPIQLLARRTYYDLRGFARYPILTIRNVQAPAQARWLSAGSIRQLDGEALGESRFLDWESVEASPSTFFLRSLYWLGVYARPATDGEIIRVHHTSLPNPLVEAADEPDIPEEFHKGLKHYALYDLLIQDGEVALALDHYEEFFVVAERLKAYVDSRQSIDRMLGFREEEYIG